jgi:putative transcriptional regulator
MAEGENRMSVIKKLREERGMTQGKLAQKMGVIRQTISAIENGNNPSVELLKRLATYFGVTTDEVLGHSPPQSLGG